jgi:hypothetical protein
MTHAEEPARHPACDEVSLDGRSAAVRGRKKSESENGRAELVANPNNAAADSYEVEFSDSGSSSVSSVACTKASEAVLTIMSSFEGCLNLTRGIEISITSQSS